MTTIFRSPLFLMQPEIGISNKLREKPAEGLLPEDKKKPTLQRTVVAGGYAVSFLSNILLLLSPLITRKSDAIIHSLEKTVGPDSAKKLLGPKQLEAIKQRIADSGKLQKSIWRALGVGYLLQAPLEYETSLNTKQPSMLLYNLISTLTSASMLFSTHILFRTLGVVGGIFYRAGKQNDIENSNHLGDRREWDLHRLTRFVGIPGPHTAATDVKRAPHNLAQELESCMRFIAGDMRNIFSAAPWKTLLGTYNQRETWTQPNANLSALSGQFALLAGASSILCTLKALSPVANALQWATNAGIVLRDLSFDAPIFSRAWQNRTEPEGLMVIGSTPFAIVGSVFYLFKKYFFLSSLSGLANPFWTKGINLNSEHRLAAIDYIKQIHANTLHNPALSASDVLGYLQNNPTAEKMLRKQTGKSGLAFIRQTLQQADTAQRRAGTSLERALHPITLSKE